MVVQPARLEISATKASERSILAREYTAVDRFLRAQRSDLERVVVDLATRLADLLGVIAAGTVRDAPDDR